MILTIVPEKQLYSELRSLEPWPGKRHMEYGEWKKPKGRLRDKAWDMVDHLPNESKRWICRHCKNTYAGDVTRVKRHLARTGGGGIVPCPDVPPKIQQDALELLKESDTLRERRKQRATEHAGDVTRVKRHLARTGRGGIVPCPDVPPKIQQDALELLKESDTLRERRKQRATEQEK